MSNPDSQDDMTALVIRSAHDLATRSSLVIRGLRDISNGFEEDFFTSAERHAMKLFEHGKFDEVIAICTSGLEADPKDARARQFLWLLKSYCFQEQEKYEEFCQCVAALVEIDVSNPAYWCLGAQALHGLDKYEEELDLWQIAIKIDSHHSGAWGGIGDCLFALERYQEAVEAFDSELKLNPSDDYCQSRREIAVVAMSRQDGELIRSADLVPSLMITLDHWWPEPSPKSELADMTLGRRSFKLVCKVESISDREQLLGKEMSVLHRFKNTDQVYWVGDAMFVEFDAIPKKIEPNSEWIPVVLEVTWLCTSHEKSDADCVQEFVSSAHETFGYDDTFGTVVQFVWDG